MINAYKSFFPAVLLFFSLESAWAMRDALGAPNQISTPIEEEKEILTPDNMIAPLKANFKEFQNDPSSHKTSLGVPELTAIHTVLAQLNKKYAQSGNQCFSIKINFIEIKSVKMY